MQVRVMNRSSGAAPETSFQDSYRWFYHSGSWQRSRSLTAAQRPLDRYQWTTPDHLAPRPATEVHMTPEEQGRAGLRGRIPYFRSRSEPGTGKGKAGPDSSLLTSITQRISRFLTKQPGPESGRRTASCLYESVFPLSRPHRGGRGYQHWI